MERPRGCTVLSVCILTGASMEMCTPYRMHPFSGPRDTEMHSLLLQTASASASLSSGSPPGAERNTAFVQLYVCLRFQSGTAGHLAGQQSSAAWPVALANN